MRRTIAVATVVVSVFFLFALAVPRSGWGQVKVPDITYEKAKGSPGPVTFSHDSHAQQRGIKCTECHAKSFKMKKFSAEWKMAAMDKGEGCGTCHNGKVAFATSDKETCAKCHTKK